MLPDSLRPDKGNKKVKNAAKAAAAEKNDNEAKVMEEVKR